VDLATDLTAVGPTGRLVKLLSSVSNTPVFHYKYAHSGTQSFGDKVAFSSWKLAFKDWLQSRGLGEASFLFL